MICGILAQPSTPAPPRAVPPDAAGDAEADALAAADGDAAVGVAFESDAHDVTSSDAAMRVSTTKATDHPIAFGRDSRPGGGVAVNGDREAGGRG